VGVVVVVLLVTRTLPTDDTFIAFVSMSGVEASNLFSRNCGNGNKYYLRPMCARDQTCLYQSNSTVQNSN